MMILQQMTLKQTEEATKLVVGASNVPHAEILEEAKPLLKEKGIELEIEDIPRLCTYQTKH